MQAIAYVNSSFTAQLQISWLWRRDTMWLLVAWELTMIVLAAVFPVAMLELSFGMLALPVLLFVLAPESSREEESWAAPSAPSAPPQDVATGSGEASPSSPSRVANALPQIVEVGVQMRSLFSCLGIIFAINLLPLVVQVSPGLVEACTVVMFVVLGHLLLSKTALVHAHLQSQKAEKSKADEVPEELFPPPAEDAELLAEFGIATGDAPPEEVAAPEPWPEDSDDGEEAEAAGVAEPHQQDEQEPQQAEAPEEPEPEVKSQKLVWADVEEDDFQHALAKHQPDYTKLPAHDAGAAGRVDAARSEGSRGRGGGASGGGAGANRRKEGGGKPRDRPPREEQPKSAPFTAKIRACGRAGDLPGALAAVEEAMASGLPNTSEVQNALLYALVHCGEAAGTSADELFEQMKSAKQADVVSFNIMLRAFLDAGNHDRAKELLHEMAEHGLSANKVTLNELLGDRVKAGDRPGMWRVINEMRATGFGITNVACSLLLKGLNEGTPKVEVRKALALLDELVEPMDEALCSSAIEACLRVKELDTASEFMASLGNLKVKNKSAGLSPATYGSMIKAHGQARDLTQTWATWNTMFKNGTAPSAVTFGCMAEALVMNGAVDDAWRLLHEILANEEHADCVNTVIYSTVMKGFSHARRPEQCFEVLDEMRERGVEANTITYNTLLDACAKCNAMARVPQVFEEMKLNRVEPDKITYSTLIKGYCMVGDLDCAFDLFEEMKADCKVGLDEIVYNALIDGCGRQQKVGRALQVLADMRKAKIPPSNYTLSILVKLLGRAHKLNDAIALVDDFRTNYRVKPNIQVYTCLMQACLLNKRVNQAVSVYNNMVTELNCQPDQKAYCVLLIGCMQAGALKEAVEVARCAYGLPSQELAAPERGGEEVVGVEAKLLSSLGAKIRGAKLGPEVVKAWDEVVEKAGRCRPTGGKGEGKGRGYDDKGKGGKGDGKGKGSSRSKGRGKGEKGEKGDRSDNVHFQ